MNPIKVAAMVALMATVIAVGYMGFIYVEGRITFRAEMAVLSCAQLKTQYGPAYSCEQENTRLEYEVAGGIAVVGLIAWLTLSRAAKPKR